MTDRSTLDAMRSSRIVAYSMGALFVIAGIVLLAWPDRTVTVVGRIAGVLLVVVGLGEVFEGFGSRKQHDGWGFLLLRGVLNLVMGGLLLFWPNPTLTVVVFVFGLDLLLTGLVALIASRQVPPEMGRSGLVIRGVVGIVAGLVVMIWPSATLTVVVWIIGIELLLLGAVLLVSGFQLSKAAREA